MVALLEEHDFVAKRHPQKGIHDEGDLYIVGKDLLLECKAQETMCFPAWIRKSRKKNPNWVILYKDDRRLKEAVGAIAVMPAEFFVGLLSWADNAVKQAALAAVLRPMAGE